MGSLFQSAWAKNSFVVVPPTDSCTHPAAAPLDRAAKAKEPPAAASKDLATTVLSLSVKSYNPTWELRLAAISCALIFAVELVRATVYPVPSTVTVQSLAEVAAVLIVNSCISLVPPYSC